MQQRAVTDREPLWLKAASWPVGVRMAVIGGAFVAYAATVLLISPQIAFALRPLNLITLFLGGLFFGLRGGVVVGLIASALNIPLYASIGILAPSGGALAGNVLAAAIAVCVAAAFGQIRDLTFAHRAEVALRRSAQRQRTDLTTHVVHDLKNPLVGITGHAQVLLEPGHSEEERNESARYIRLAGQRMTRMLMNLLDEEKAEEGKLIPRPQPFTVGDLLDEVEREVRHHLAYRDQTLHVVREADAHIEADLDLVRRILLNLVENASKYTPRGRKVEVKIDGDANEVELVVCDQGPGIPVGYEKQIFERFSRLDRDRKTEDQTSRGIGLHFCRVAAEAHGGRIWVEPNVPQGSVFRVRLPRRALPRA